MDTTAPKFAIGTVVNLESNDAVLMTVSGVEYTDVYGHWYTPCIWFDSNNQLQKANIRTDALRG